MTRLGDWLKAHWKAEPDTMPHDLAALCAKQHEALEKRVTAYGKEHPNTVEAVAALRAAKEFQERYS